MTKTNKIQNSLVILFIIILLFISGFRVYADSPPKAGITVAPAVVNLNVTQVDNNPVSWVGVRNNYSVPVKFIAELKGVDQAQGTLTPNKNLPVELADNLIVSPNSFTLEPGKSINIQITMRNGKKASPGGSYAALVLRSNESNTGIGVKSAVSVAIFIINENGIRADLGIESLKINRFLWGMPRSAVVDFKNNGNVLVVPRGSIVVSDSLEKTAYTKAVVNERSLPVLPGNFLKLNANFIKNSQFLFPGFKKVIVVYRFDGSDKQQAYMQKFLYIPQWLIFLTMSIPIVIIYLIYKKKIKKTYKHGSKESRKRLKNAPPKKPKIKINVISEDSEQKIAISR